MTSRKGFSHGLSVILIPNSHIWKDRLQPIHTCNSHLASRSFLTTEFTTLTKPSLVAAEQMHMATSGRESPSSIRSRMPGRA